jgi:hypothetical protein
VGWLLNFKTSGREKIEEIIQTRGYVNEVLISHPWKGKICFAVQCFGLLYSNSLSIFKIFLPIHSSVGCRNLLHQLIENSSQYNHFNNSLVNVSIPQLHCCMIYFLLSLDFCCIFRAHIPQLSLGLFSIGPDADENNSIGECSQVNCFHLTMSFSPMVLNTPIHFS